MTITKNPIKMATLTFACLAVLFFVAALSGATDNKPRFLLGGILYSLFLAYFATGAILLAKKRRRLLRYVLSLFTLLMFGFIILIYYYAVRKAEFPTGIIDNIGHVQILLVCPVFAVMIIAPALGWIGYYRIEV